MQRKKDLTKIYINNYNKIGEKARNEFLHFINENFGYIDKNNIDEKSKKLLSEMMSKEMKIKDFTIKKKLFEERLRKIREKEKRFFNPTEKRKRMKNYSSQSFLYLGN